MPVGRRGALPGDSTAGMVSQSPVPVPVLPKHRHPPAERLLGLTRTRLRLDAFYPVARRARLPLPGLRACREPPCAESSSQRHA